MKKLNRLDMCILISILIYVAFNGCFMFPICKELFNFSYGDILAFLVTYGIIGVGLSYVFTTHRSFLVFTLILIFTIIGMLCRYYYQFGGVSNNLYFTMKNISLYITLVPMYCTMVYRGNLIY